MRADPTNPTSRCSCAGFTPIFDCLSIHVSILLQTIYSFFDYRMHCNKRQTNCWHEFAGNTMAQHDEHGAAFFAFRFSSGFLSPRNFVLARSFKAQARIKAEQQSSDLLSSCF